MKDVRMHAHQLNFSLGAANVLINSPGEFMSLISQSLSKSSAPLRARTSPTVLFYLI